MVHSILYSLVCFSCQNLLSQKSSPNSHQSFVEYEVDLSPSKGHLLMTKPSSFITFCLWWYWIHCRAMFGIHVVLQLMWQSANLSYWLIFSWCCSSLFACNDGFVVHEFSWGFGHWKTKLQLLNNISFHLAKLITLYLQWTVSFNSDIPSALPEPSPCLPLNLYL